MSFLGSIGKAFSRGVAAVATGGLSELVPAIRPAAEELLVNAPLKAISQGTLTTGPKPKMPGSSLVVLPSGGGGGGVGPSPYLPVNQSRAQPVTTGSYYGPIGSLPSVGGGNPSWLYSGTSAASSGGFQTFSGISGDQWVLQGSSVRRY